MKGHDVVTGAGPVPHWIRRWAPSVTAGGTALDGALEALEEALRRPGRDRDAACALLAADALLTTTLEVAVQADEPEAHLREALQEVVRRAEARPPAPEGPPPPPPGGPEGPRPPEVS